MSFRDPSWGLCCLIFRVLCVAAPAILLLSPACVESRRAPCEGDGKWLQCLEDGSLKFFAWRGQIKKYIQWVCTVKPSQKQHLFRAFTGLCIYFHRFKCLQAPWQGSLSNGCPNTLFSFSLFPHLWTQSCYFYCRGKRQEHLAILFCLCLHRHWLSQPVTRPSSLSRAWTDGKAVSFVYIYE